MNSRDGYGVASGHRRALATTQATEPHAGGGKSHQVRDLANGKIDGEGCLVCPWYHARYAPATGRMVVGPQAGFQKVPGLDTAFIQLTKLWPLRRAEVVEREGQVYARA